MGSEKWEGGKVGSETAVGGHHAPMPCSTLFKFSLGLVRVERRGFSPALFHSPPEGLTYWSLRRRMADRLYSITCSSFS